MQEKNRLFVLDLFRNCVDRTANMRSFIASMGGPKGGAKAPDRPLLMHSKPVMEPSKDTSQAVVTVTAGATEAVAMGRRAEHGAVQSSSSSSSASSSSSKPKEINSEAVKCPKRKTPLSSSSSSSGDRACASVKKSIPPQGYSEAKHTAASSSAVIELSDAEEEDEGALDSGDDIIVQRVKRKKGPVTVTMKSSDRSGCAEILVTPECSVGAGEGDRRVAASASHASRWVCAICTYCHRPEEWQYLQCALCASNRPALSVPSQVC